MIGLKIALTGLVVLAIAYFFIKAIGSATPGILISIPLICMWFGGVLAIIAGLIVAIWS